MLSNATGSPTHVLAWRPIPVGEVENPSDIVPLQFDVGFTATATAAYSINGAAPNGTVPATLPVIGGASWSMPVSGIPTLVAVAPA